MAQRKERKRLDMLDALKSRCGRFTDSGEVEKFLKNNVKQQRMKLEVKFARVFCLKSILSSKSR